MGLTLKWFSSQEDNVDETGGVGVYGICHSKQKFARFATSAINYRCCPLMLVRWLYYYILQPSLQILPKLISSCILRHRPYTVQCWLIKEAAEMLPLTKRWRCPTHTLFDSAAQLKAKLDVTDKAILNRNNRLQFGKIICEIAIALSSNNQRLR